MDSFLGPKYISSQENFFICARHTIPNEFEPFFHILILILFNQQPICQLAMLMKDVELEKGNEEKEKGQKSNSLTFKN